MSEIKLAKHIGVNSAVGISGHAETISSLINSKDHMVKIKPNTVESYIDKNLAVWATDPQTSQFCGFIKALPWHPTLVHVKGGMEEIEEVAIQNVIQGLSPTGIESGSLIVPDIYQGKGIGYEMKQTLADHVITHYPGVPLFSVVDITNEKSVGLNMKQGWKQLIQGVDIEKINTLMDIVGVDIIQGWNEACIFLHPQSYKQIYG